MSTYLSTPFAAPLAAARVVLCGTAGLTPRRPRRHAFHCKCLNPWLERSSTCPCCRGKLMEEHVHHAITASSAVAAPSDVAHFLREGSTMMPSPSGDNARWQAHVDGALRMDGRAELYLDTSAAPAESGGSPITEQAAEASDPPVGWYQRLINPNLLGSDEQAHT